MLNPDGLDLLFAAVETDAARELEPRYAKYLALSHNTLLGAAKGMVLTAEYLCRTGML